MLRSPSARRTRTPRARHLAFAPGAESIIDSPGRCDHLLRVAPRSGTALLANSSLTSVDLTTRRDDRHETAARGFAKRSQLRSAPILRNEAKLDTLDVG